MQLPNLQKLTDISHILSFGRVLYVTEKAGKVSQRLAFFCKKGTWDDLCDRNQSKTVTVAGLSKHYETSLYL